MSEENNGLEEFEKLRLENKLNKKRLEDKYDAKFYSENTQLNPLIESEFLHYIEQFEDAYDSAKLISVYDYIGKPEFRKVETISDAEIGQMLENIMELLNKNNIDLDTLCEVEEREIYRFITEELFLHEIDDMRIDGMITNFIYEEFHPNHDYDIRKNCTDFIISFLEKESDFYTTWLTKEAEQNIKLRNFRNAFRNFSLQHFEISFIQFNEIQATVNFVIDFSGIIDGSNDIQSYSGEGKMELVYQYDYWCIQSIYLPGLSVEQYKN